MNTRSAMTAFPARRSARRSFTLTELMVAVAVLIVVIIATSKIFGTASKITGLGQATAAVMQEAATIERQIREDFEKLSCEGFFAIHCVSVQNDVKGAGFPLLNPNLPPGALVRADQLVFFTNGNESIQTYRLGAGANHKSQSTAVRVYWGQTFQLGQSGLPAVTPNPAVNLVNGYDPIAGAGNWFNITPWKTGALAMGLIRYCTIAASAGGSAGTDIFSSSAASPNSINLAQPDARQWLLARQTVVLADDDGGAGNSNQKTVYLNDQQQARSIFLNGNANLPWGFSREIRNGRLDAAASQMSDIRRYVQFVVYPPSNPGQVRAWNAGTAFDQRAIIQGAVYYPRAERRAPSMNRIDQCLTNHVISGGCSSFVVDWTYDDGVGAVDSNHDGDYLDAGDYLGVQIPPNFEQPWFGFADPLRGVYPYAQLPASNPGGLVAAQTILPVNTYPNNIESSTTLSPLPAGVNDYWALFGYNQTQAVDNSVPPVPVQTLGYTPFPSAIRITMTLHDPEGKLEGGREFQFVINLPKQTP